MSKDRRDSGSGDSGRDSRRSSPRGTPPRRNLPVQPGRPFRQLAFWVLVILLCVAGFRISQGSFMAPQRAEVSFTRFIQEVEKGNIQDLQIVERSVTGDLKVESSHKVDGRDQTFKAFKANIVGDGAELPALVWKTNPGVEIEVRSAGFSWAMLLLQWLPLILIFGAWMFVLRQMQSGGSAALKFGKTKARVLLESNPKITFKDVAGCDEAKQELQEIIEFLKEPQKFQKLGARIPKGALLLGPPGTGKTLLAKAVAGEAGVPFFSMSGSDFVEMFVGVGASVTGDTPIVVRHEGRTRLVPIGEFVDSFYADGKSDFVVPVTGVETLGFEELDSKFKGSSKTFVQGSAWKNARGVLRHRVTEIHEIKYLGGTLRTTGDHSVFVRTRDGIKSVPASELKAGDVLVQLPMKVRGEFSAEYGTPHSTRSHSFESSEDRWLEVAPSDDAAETAYDFALANADVMPQHQIASAIGVSQMTVSNWQTGRHEPSAITTRRPSTPVADRVKVTPELLKLLGYYTAEGRENGCLEFTFGTHEPDLHADVLALVRDQFGVEGKVQHTADNSTKLVFHSAPLGRFFADQCGTGSHEKHVPEMLWDLPYEYFQAYMTGYALGDGYVSKEGKLSVTSVSHQLIRELTWLCAMHGIPSGVRHQTLEAGRVIKTKPLPAGESWNLIIGKTSHWMVRDRSRQGKRAIVQSVETKPFEGFVYDLCGCDNEAFFGGEKPVLLHNSRVRDLFEQGKRNAPCITGDSVVTLSGGKQITIGEMFDKKLVGVKVPAMTDDFRFEDATVLGITRKPSKELFTITTATSEIRATGNHLFPVMRGEGMKWVPAEELTTSDYVAAPRVIATTSEAPSFYDFQPTPTPSYVGSYERGLVAPARASMQAAVMELDEPRESAVLWSRITKIEKNASDEPVYDLCLNRVNCFIANNLVVHNCILFIDEIDAVGRHRGAGLGGGHDEREQTLNQLLVEMDGFESNDGVIIVAATNRPDVLDPALMRPGRFDRQIVVDWPDVRGREGILAVHAKKRPLADDVNLPLLARSTPGMSGADLENLVNEAALLAARRNRKKVTMADFEDAKDKVMLGTERRSLVMTEVELRTTAYHEAGHALVAWLLPDADPVTKITIVPRGRALGVTAYAPTEERHNNSKKQLEDRLSYAMGGRAAELLIFSHLTTGAVSDLEQATGIARAMVTRFGMSDKLGPLSFGKRDEMVFLGREMTSSKDYSEETAVLIDSEVRVIIEAAHANAVRLLTENLDKLHLLAKTLLERETLDGDEMVRLLNGETLPPVKTEEPPSEPAPPAAVTSVVEGQTGMGGLGALPPPAPRPAGA